MMRLSRIWCIAGWPDRPNRNLLLANGLTEQFQTIGNLNNAPSGTGQSNTFFLIASFSAFALESSSRFYQRFDPLNLRLKRNEFQIDYLDWRAVVIENLPFPRDAFMERRTRFNNIWTLEEFPPPSAKANVKALVNFAISSNGKASVFCEICIPVENRKRN